MEPTKPPKETTAERLRRLDPVVRELATLPKDERRQRIRTMDQGDLEFLAAVSVVSRLFRNGKPPEDC